MKHPYIAIILTLTCLQAALSQPGDPPLPQPSQDTSVYGKLMERIHRLEEDLDGMKQEMEMQQEETIRQKQEEELENLLKEAGA